VSKVSLQSDLRGFAQKVTQPAKQVCIWLLAREAGVSIKPGAQAPGSDHKRHAEARENGRQREISSLSPTIAGSRSFYLAR
jgi:hypothetical protein